MQELEHYFYLGDDRTMERPASAVQPGEAGLREPTKTYAYTGGGIRTASGLRRTSFQMQFEPSLISGYIEDQKRVWPEMQEALRSTGWSNYSLYLRPDGFAVG